METSTTHRNKPRAKSARFGRIVSAAAFGLLICAFAVGSAQAKHNDDGDHGDRGHGRGHEERHEYRGRGYYRGPDYAYGNPGYYYAPPPDYYDEPDPYDYGYYPPEPGYYPGPSDGILQFFGL